MTYMDGKSGAEELIAKLMQDPALLASMTAVPKGDDPEASGDGETPSDSDGGGDVDDQLSDL
jgi:type VI secretion system protein ImpB